MTSELISERESISLIFERDTISQPIKRRRGDYHVPGIWP